MNYVDQGKLDDGFVFVNELVAKRYESPQLNAALDAVARYALSLVEASEIELALRETSESQLDDASAAVEALAQLGIHVSSERFRAAPHMIAPDKEWSEPQCLTELRALEGLVPHEERDDFILLLEEVVDELRLTAIRLSCFRQRTAARDDSIAAAQQLLIAARREHGLEG